MSDSQTLMTDAEKQAIVEAAAKQEASQKDGKDEVLAVLNESLKRDFKTRDEALKSLDNLNRMVGDNAIADLRKKAADSDNFDRVVRAYAEMQGLEYAEARAEILKDVSEKKKEERSERTETSTSSSLESEVKNLRLKIQEKELLEFYPEAKTVLKELKDLAQIYSGKELKEIYESSALKDMAGKAMALEKEKMEKESTAVKTSPRQANLQEEKFKSLVDSVKKRGFDDDKEKLVEHYFQQLAA